MKEEAVDIGVIGGSGLYQIDELADVHEVRMSTPFGEPSDAIRIGNLSGKKVAFLPRHGRHHSLLPSEVPHRANIFAIKKLGARWIISMSAVGSLKEKIRPGDFVFPDQFVDRTKQSESHSFFGKGIVAHVSFSQPVCTYLQTILYQSARAVGVNCHWNGIYLNMEGPVFSTRAESEMHRTLGFSIVGMTNLAEAKLAREAQISYATMAMVTDFDCWHGEEKDANVKEIMQTLQQNSNSAKKVLVHALSQIQINTNTPCHHALENAIITPPEHWPPVRAKELALLLSEKP